ncbi:MAG: hypothetical protein FWG31_04455 [Oscillospiraceae bacterium]|nr:hypothetical protein [Oscillospiraceae bacterium]
MKEDQGHMNRPSLDSDSDNRVFDRIRDPETRVPQRPGRMTAILAACCMLLVMGGFAYRYLFSSNEPSLPVVEEPENPSVELYTFPYEKYNERVTFQTEYGIYPASVQSINATLTNAGLDVLSCGKSFRIVKKSGDDWVTVPFDAYFNLIGIMLIIGQSETYTLHYEMLNERLTPGVYRLVTEVGHRGISKDELADSEDPAEDMQFGERPVWAEFTIVETVDYYIDIPPSSKYNGSILLPQ